MLPLLLEACPSFYRDWEDWVRDQYSGDNGLEQLHYCDLGHFASHLVELLERGETSEFKEVFRVVENLHLNGDGYVREAATIGLLEGIQNVISHGDHTSSEFEPFLGPETKMWWDKLNEFWEGKPSAERSLGEGLLVWLRGFWKGSGRGI